MPPADQQDTGGGLHTHGGAHPAHTLPGGHHRYRWAIVAQIPELTCVTAGNLLHTRLDPDQGPLWRVQIVSLATFEAASPGLSLGPEMEAILQDDSDTETRWRYYLRYLQVGWSGY